MAHADDQASVLDPPCVLSFDRRDAAIIGFVVPRPDMPVVMGPAIAELQEALRSQGITRSGPMFAHHLRMDNGVFDVEVGFLVDRPIKAAGRVRPGALPAAAVVRATYRGDYGGLYKAWSELRRWIDEHGHARTADLWETYLCGPDKSVNPADWQTELNQPLRQ